VHLSSGRVESDADADASASAASASRARDSAAAASRRSRASVSSALPAAASNWLLSSCGSATSSEGAGKGRWRSAVSVPG